MTVRSRRSKRAPAAGAAAVLAAGALLASCGGGHRHTTTPTTPVAGSVPATSTSTTVPRGPYQWSRDPSPALAIGGGASTTIAAIEAPSAGRPWLVAGTRFSASGSTTATVWHSADGAGWRAEALTGPGVDSEAAAATPWHAGTVVVGSVGQGNNQSAAVWISPAPDAPFVQVPAAQLPTGAARMATIASGALGLFATGAASGHVAMWYSSNGHRWTRLVAAEQVINGADQPHITSLTVASDGVFAAGWQQDGDRTDAALWTSADGVHWRPVLTAQAAFAGGGDRVISAVVAVGTSSVPTGFVAVGGIRLGTHWEPASWISPNGASWSEPSHAFGMAPRPQGGAGDTVVRAMSIATNGPESATLVAVGGSATAQRLWRSTDGVHWSELPLPAAAADSPSWTASLVASQGAALAVASGVPGQPHLLVDPGSAWSEPSAHAPTFGPVQGVALPVGMAAAPTGLLVAVRITPPTQALAPTPAGTSLDFLTSPDGTSWQSHPAGPAFSGATIGAITAFRGGFVAVGDRTVAGQPWAAAWASRDGVNWTAGPLLDRLPSAANGTCQRGTIVAAVGVAASHGTAAARAWASADGVHWAVARVATTPRPPASYTMSGCVTSGSAFEAYGTERVAGPDGTVGGPVPAAWVGTPTGAAWVPQSGNSFGLPAPLTDLAVSARSSLALVTDGSVLEGSTALYESADAGATWQALDLTAQPWAGAGPATATQVAWWLTTPVVAGQVDGQLALWTGTPST